MKIVTEHRGKMIVKFNSIPTDEFYTLLDITKNIPGRRWVANTQSWELPINKNNIELFIKLGFDVEQKLKNQSGNVEKNNSELLQEIESKFNSDILFPWQHKHTKQLIYDLITNGSALDASDTGAGKTFVALQIAKYFNLPVIALVPKTAIYKWEKVAKIFKVKIFASNYEQFKNGNTKYLFADKVVTYNKKKQMNEEVKYFTWITETPHLIIFDEAHRCKNRKTQNSDMLLQSIKTENKIICLSATIADNPLQLYALGNVLGLFKSEKEFWFWCFKRGVKKKYFGVEFDSTPENLNKIHNDIFPDKGSRISVKELSDFPENLIMAESYTMESSDEIQKIYDEMKEELHKVKEAAKEDIKKAKGEKISPLTILLRARQEVELLKIPTFIELAEDHVEEGMSVAIFLNFEASIQAIKERLKTDCIITGKVSAVEKENNRIAFQKGEQRIIILNNQAGGESIDLHDEFGNYPRVSLISPTFSAQNLKQILGRLPRAGAKSKVLQKIIFAAETVEEEVADKVQKKIQNIATINDGDLNKI